MNETPQVWHYGRVARWWAEFNTDGPEIAYFQCLIEQYGQPAPDVACGTGRLLIPYLWAGFDDVQVRGDYSEAEATPDSGILVYLARR